MDALGALDPLGDASLSLEDFCRGVSSLIDTQGNYNSFKQINQMSGFNGTFHIMLF